MALKKVSYWISTGFVSLVIGISGAMSIAHAAPLMKALAHLGYPTYFANILGVGKTLGLVFFLVPRNTRFKEWAYAGFAITILAASYSHFSSGDRLPALDPLATFAALVVSYFTRPDSRKLPDSVPLF